MEDAEVQSRICTKCKERKSIEDFYRQKGGKFGRRPSCKACCNEYVRNYRKTLSPEQLEKDRASRREFSRKYRARKKKSV